MEKNNLQVKAELIKKLNHLYQAPTIPSELQEEVNKDLEALVEKLKQAL